MSEVSRSNIYALIALFCVRLSCQTQRNMFTAPELRLGVLAVVSDKINRDPDRPEKKRRITYASVRRNRVIATSLGLLFLLFPFHLCERIALFDLWTPLPCSMCYTYVERMLVKGSTSRANFWNEFSPLGGTQDPEDDVSLKPFFRLCAFFPVLRSVCTFNASIDDCSWAVFLMG